MVSKKKVGVGVVPVQMRGTTWTCATGADEAEDETKALGIGTKRACVVAVAQRRG